MIRDNKPRAELLNHSPLSLSVFATRTCRDSMDRSDTVIETDSAWIGTDTIGEKDKKMLSEKVLGQKRKYNPLNPTHESVIEHIYYTFLCRFSRDVLQELSRHRIASESVQSTRASLGKLFNRAIDGESLANFLHQVEPEDVKGDTELAERINQENIDQLECAIEIKLAGAPNDVVKYLLPGAFMTEAVFTINARSLRNFFTLRTGKPALKEIRQLAFAMLEVIPESHLFLFEDRVHWQYCPWVIPR